MPTTGAGSGRSEATGTTRRCQPPLSCFSSPYLFRSVSGEKVGEPMSHQGKGALHHPLLHHPETALKWGGGATVVPLSAGQGALGTQRGFGLGGITLKYPRRTCPTVRPSGVAPPVMVVFGLAARRAADIGHGICPRPLVASCRPRLVTLGGGRTCGPSTLPTLGPSCSSGVPSSCAARTVASSATPVDNFVVAVTSRLGGNHCCAGTMAPSWQP